MNIFEGQFSHRCHTCENYVQAGGDHGVIGHCDAHNRTTSAIGTCTSHKERVGSDRFSAASIPQLVNSIPIEIRIYTILEYLIEVNHLYKLPAGLLIDAKEVLDGPAHFTFTEGRIKQLKKLTGLDLSLFLREKK